jgi:cytokinin dehydrogenase
MNQGAVRFARGKSTFQAVGLGLLDGLCAAARFPEQRRTQALRTLADMLVPWGEWLVGDQPRFPSDIGDDHFPIEHSLAASGSDLELRVLLEAQAPSCQLPDLWAAGWALSARLASRHGADLQRFEKIAELFEPHAGARYAMWHAACFSGRADPTFKLYVNPQARGQDHAPAIVAEALLRLGFSPAAVKIATAPRPGGALKFFALDLERGPNARVKVYYAHHGADRHRIEAELSHVPGFSPERLSPFWSAVADHDGPFEGLPVTTYLSFTDGHDRPTSGIVHFPVRDYADNDQVVYGRVMTLLDGPERELYARAVAGFATRPLDGGVGLQTYVAQKVGSGERRVTVYLSPEGYRVRPARAQGRTASRRVSLESTLASLGFRGETATDDGARRWASTDVGRLVSKAPRAILRPRGVEDLQIAVRACQRHGVPLVARGQGRTPFGQSQIEDGVLVDMGKLSRIHSICKDALTVDAGATWGAVLRETAPHRLAPPVLTAFQGLSVGGTLSVGGLSGVSYKRGAQVDQVFELEVVTGEGELVTCSRLAHPELFDMVRAGLGQCAVIARAKLLLVPTPAWVRHVTRRYRSLRPFLSDLRELVARAELDGISGTFHVEPQGVAIELNAVSFMEPEAAPDMAHLLRGLAEPAEVTTRDLERVAYYSEVDKLVSELQVSSAWDELARPWFDVFLADAAIDDYIPSVLAELSASEDVGAPELGALGQLHLFPLLGEHLQSPLLRVPPGRLVHLFDILTCGRTPRDEAWAQRMLQRNRRLFERARDVGATRYNIAAIPFSPEDWKTQLGPRYEELRRIKHAFDPDRILNPGLGVFS